VLTFSKGAYLALFALLVLVIVTVPRWRVAVVAVVTVGVVVATQVPLLVARMETIASSVDGRIQVFGNALEVIRSHPVFGVGLAGYSYSFRSARPVIYPHNIWLTFWVEVGLIGLAAFAVVFLGAMWRGWRRWPAAEGFWRVALWGSLAALLMWLAHGFVDSPYWKNDMSVEFWMLIALVTVALRAEVGRLEKLEVVSGAVVADRPLATVR